MVTHYIRCLLKRNSCKTKKSVFISRYKNHCRYIYKNDVISVLNFPKIHCSYLLLHQPQGAWSMGQSGPMETCGHLLVLSVHSVSVPRGQWPVIVSSATALTPMSTPCAALTATRGPHACTKHNHTALSTVVSDGSTSARLVNVW